MVYLSGRVYKSGMEAAMRCSVSDAKARLTDLVRRAEAGEDVVLTRHDHEVARLVPVRSRRASDDFDQRIKAIQASVRAKVAAGKAKRWPGAARSQDFLYDDKGLPG